MKLPEVYSTQDFVVSFELFPPKTEKGLTALHRHVEKLVERQPSFMTCTYGAGGSTRSKTLEIVKSIKQRFNLPVASHLTCVGATQSELHDYLREASEAEIDYIVALRGDPPKGESQFRAVEGGFRYANELVAMIRQEFPHFGIAVAGYPEKHQEAVSFEIDLENLKRKVEAGGDVVITQLFYDNTDFFRFIDRTNEMGIDVPIVPGMLPVTNLKQIQRLTSLCGARLPDSFVDKLAERDDPEWQFEVGVEFAIKQAQELVDFGVPGMHFYVLNKSQATCRIVDTLGI